MREINGRKVIGWRYVFDSIDVLGREDRVGVLGGYLPAFLFGFGWHTHSAAPICFFPCRMMRAVGKIRMGESARKSG